MSPDTRSYNLNAAAPWPVALSVSRVDALGPGQIAMLSATLSVPGGSSDETGEIRVTAVDRKSYAPLARTVFIRIQVTIPAGSGGTAEIRRVVR